MTYNQLVILFKQLKDVGYKKHEALDRFYCHEFSEVVDGSLVSSALALVYDNTKGDK